MKPHLNPDVVELATAIHNLTCNLNHTDMCGWGYECWDDRGGIIYEKQRTRPRYYQRAMNVIKKMDKSAADVVLDIKTMTEFLKIIKETQ